MEAFQNNNTNYFALFKSMFYLRPIITSKRVESYRNAFIENSTSLQSV
jgi:hypothetical protein